MVVKTETLGRLRRALLEALAVISPVYCAGCGTPDESLCASCRIELTPVVTPRSLADGTTVFTALRYEGVVRRAILALKESGRTDVAGPLSVPLAEALARATQPGAEVLVVPTSSAAWRRRGYDPVALLAKRAGVRHARVLRSVRRTASQKTLGASERSINVSNSMVSRSALHGRRFILVDDVVTTGATLNEASRAISAAGGEVVGRAALAFTPRIS